MCAMKLGVAAWVTDRGVGVADLARAVEETGFESLFLAGHTHVPTSRRDLMDGTRPGEDARLLDQFTALGVAAATTTRLKLGTGVCVVPQYDPIVLAKQVATIDHLSGGRFVFGVGAGWLVEELRNHGIEPARRWDLMAEQILAMKAIWRDEEAQFHGELVDFDPIWSWPKPIQKPHPPLLVGGSSTPSLRLAATAAAR
jgi:probable F420-dependent oxidoreductase